MNIKQIKKKIMIISGPTATGKTALAIHLAKKIGSIEIINFDSLLFYKELSIGTAKPTAQELSEVNHHLINIASIHAPLNGHDYQLMAEKTIIELTENNISPILVGGSGFYLRALTQGMYLSKTTPPDVQKRSDELYEKEGITPFSQFLAKVDTETFSRLHPNDHYRIRRAVEHFWTNQTKFSDSKSQLEKAKISKRKISFENMLHIHLDIPKEEHLQIISNRTKNMIKNGLVEETINLLKMGASGLERPLQSIGYFETLQFLRGEIKTLDDLEERINISTRQLAKSQRTWFKKVTEKITFNPLKEIDSIEESVLKFLKCN